MQSSYKNNVEFGDILASIIYIKNPKLIVEFGILNGYSLSKFIEFSDETTDIKAYDIFDDFNGNHGNKEELKKKFSQKNVSIEYGDFYEKHQNFVDKSIDILHIDIANDGNVYEYAIKNYLPKITDNGIIILEGGSTKRDNVEWMIKYKKNKIKPIIDKYNLKLDIITLGEFPSITLLKKR